MLTILLALAAAQQPVPLKKQVDETLARSPSDSPANSTPLRPIGEKEVWIVNRTGLASARIEASNLTASGTPAKKLDAVLRAASGTLIDFEDGQRGCRYRFTIQFTDGRTFEAPDHDVCAQKHLTLGTEQLRPAR